MFLNIIVLFTAINLSNSQGIFGKLAELSAPYSYTLPKKLPPLENFDVLHITSFADFLEKTGRKYASEAEEAFRKTIFLAKKKVVDSHNDFYKKGLSSYNLALNEFSDRSQTEFLDGMTGRKKKQEQTLRATVVNKTNVITKPYLPEYFDWRQQGGVTRVKFQGLECGACWSFAVTGAIEGHVYRKTKKLIELSEQHLIDCSDDYGNTGCEGGFQDYGFDYILHNGGISRAKEYPFVERQEECRYNETFNAAAIRGYVAIDPNREDRVKEIVATLGPVTASVNAGPDSFQLYKSGIYMDDACNDGEVNHSVLIVGYGRENCTDYWIIKNSWTDKWGENGYMKLPRNVNYCGIASECSYPLV